MKKRFLAMLLAFPIVVGLAGPAEAAPAAILISQFSDGPRRVDPIVSPCPPGGSQLSAHEHIFYGVRGIRCDTRSSAALRALPSTWNRASNHSAFWTPPIYETVNGVTRRMTPLGTKPLLAYYQLRSGTIVPPEGTAGISHEMGYRCQTGGGSFSDSPPACTERTFVLGGFMRGTRDLGLPSATGFDVRVFIRLDRGRTGPMGLITCGGPPGSGHTHPCSDAHFDYIWAHDRAKFQAFINQCAPPNGPCGTDPAVLA